MSLGSVAQEYGYQTAVDTAIRAGLTVVVASGNDGHDACQNSPAFVQSTITVGATDVYNRRADFSNYGQCLDIYAPGVAIMSSSHELDNGQTVKDGTSMACPHVAGAAALLLSRNKALNAYQVKQQLLSSAQSNVISNLTMYDPNKLLWVGGSAREDVPAVTHPVVGGGANCGGGCSRRRSSGECSSRRRTNNDHCVQG
jgi:subtilisin family serine protease